ncbi:MAG: response regulator [Chitinophagaceae bacterium]|nr:response regulator [Chitinophagaceae bacterium]
MVKKVMLIDDVPIANFIMRKLIERVAPEYEVIDFTVPEQAINSMEELSPDLIFLDLNMPVIDGWQFLDLMNENNFENKVYILTSSTSELDEQQSRQYKNVMGFLIKPVNINALPAVLEVIR